MPLYCEIVEECLSRVVSCEWLAVVTCCSCLSLSPDRQIFYSRCGYNFSEAVCAFGGSSSLNIGNFAAKMTATNGAVPAPSPPVARPQPAPTSSGGGPPPPPPPPGPPPPPPSSSSSGPGGHSTPSDDLKEKCHSAFMVPTLPAEVRNMTMSDSPSYVLFYF